MLLCLGEGGAARVYFSIYVYEFASLHGRIIVSIAKFADLGGYFDDDPPRNRLTPAVEACLSVDCKNDG